MRPNPGIFFGLLLIFIGISIIVHFFVDVDLFRIIMAVFLIFAGIYMLFGRSRVLRFKSTSRDNFFSDRTIHKSPSDKTEYNVFFGKSVYDFRDIEFKENRSIKIKLNTFFGSSYIRINKEIPVKIKLNAVFAGAILPDGNTTVFGNQIYTSPGFSESKLHLYLEADVFFGHLHLSNR